MSMYALHKQIRRIHHQYSDKEGDPHSPREGTYWAHMGWIFTGRAMHHDTGILRRYVPDLSKDPFHVALTKWHWLPQVIVGLGFLAFGGSDGHVDECHIRGEDTLRCIGSDCRCEQIG